MKYNYSIKIVSLCLSLLLFTACAKTEKEPKRPNVILVMTDDQGYGDFGFTGNPFIQTPNIDTMASESAQMTNFYVSPVCAPTRASLMTGRYNYRTRCIDTFLGRAMMDTKEVTIAEIMREAGYATSIFGKWHLGDNYPMRPQDQGFDEVLVHRGGGIGQESDPPGGERKYTDPILFHNGEAVQEKGYCTDVYFEKALNWIEGKVKNEEPFFTYIATNAPHTPVGDVPEELYQHYKKMNLSNDQFPQGIGHPLGDKTDLDRRARIYAMITNIDQNMGRLFERVDELGIADNTVVIFLSDNGPNGNRYVAGMRGQKTNVLEGGIRSPFLVKWPNQLSPKTKSDRVSTHIDIMPTILDVCNISIPENLKIDGISLLSDLQDKPIEKEDRAIVLQAHRGDVPTPYHNFALRTNDWKLMNASGFHKERFEGEPIFELYNMKNDPLELNNLVDQKPEVVEKLKKEYDDWYTDVSSTRKDNYVPPRIPIGTEFENPVVLTRQDWRKISENPWLEHATGFWRLKSDNAAVYDVLVRFRKVELAGDIELKVRDAMYTGKINDQENEVIFENIRIESGVLDIQANLNISKTDRVGSWQIELLKR